MQSRVYKNLTKRDSQGIPLWSIKQKVKGKWVVVGHCREVDMVNVSSTVSDKRHDYVRSGNHREVFAWLSGDIVAVKGFQGYQGRDVELLPVVDSPLQGSPLFDTDSMEKVTFHPFAAEKRGFFWITGDDFEGAYRAVFTRTCEVFCYN